MRRKAFLSLLASSAALPVLRRTAGAQPAPPAAMSSAPMPTQQVQGPAAPASASPVLAAVIEQQFIPMKQTRYQHNDQEDPVAETYFYDCVGMVTYTLSLGAPAAYAEIMEGLKIRKGYVPSPALYVQWFSGLTTQKPPVAAWQPVATVAAIEPGDVLAWPIEGNNPVNAGGATGHSVIAAGPPLLLSDGSYALLVYDSTATTHGPFDSRHTDPRNLPLDIQGSPQFGHPSGLGNGTIQFKVDADGAPSAIAWTVGTAAMTTTIAIGRALA